MTTTNVYELLYSRSFYEKNGAKKFRFKDNSLIIDRRALLSFVLYEESGRCYMRLSTGMFLEKHLRVECENADGCAFRFYGKETGLEALVLE